MQLRRTVPFISESLLKPNKLSLLIDTLEVLDENIGSSKLVDRLHSSLELSKEPYITSTDSILLVNAQYDCSLEYIFSHRFWKLLRESKNRALILGFLIETMHYLAAASHRMANGINVSFDCADSFVSSISKHTLEEHNHNIFFERALEEQGCDREILAFSRPLPTTFEWIHLMRFLSRIDPLCAILSSGLLEYTANDQKTIKKWHTMLIDRGILSTASVNAIYEHVQLDRKLQHNSNWENALKSLQFIECKRLCTCLNSIAAISEMYVRWLDSIIDGFSGNFVDILPKFQFKLKKTNEAISSIDYTFVSMPVFSSKIYDLVTHGGNIGKKSKELIATSFFLSRIALQNQKILECSDRNFVDSISRVIKKTSNHRLPKITRSRFTSLINKSWLLSINGHKLWQMLREKPSYSLVFGWIYENYYYISSITQHVGAAIAACSNSSIRNELVKHLDEEIDHGLILKKPLLGSRYSTLLEHIRPLPTTLAFVGALIQIAFSNWKAYCLALYYLQSTIKNRVIFKEFYNTVSDKNPDVSDLINSMAEHDAIDSNLHHDDDLEILLEMLFERTKVTYDDVLAASTVAQLSWSFLDGIQSHYKNGDISVVQRLGWWK